VTVFLQTEYLITVDNDSAQNPPCCLTSAQKAHQKSHNTRTPTRYSASGLLSSFRMACSIGSSYTWLPTGKPLAYVTCAL
jgi:hypothetical protein